jgi:hypothetical protein
MDQYEIRQLARAIVSEMDSKYSGDLAKKWAGGSILFMPGTSDVKDHEMPITKFLQKVIRVRESLRVLEQQINKSDNLSEGEKIKFEGYITKCYGSLTSFNFMFNDEEDKF